MGEWPHPLSPVQCCLGIQVRSAFPDSGADAAWRISESTHLPYGTLKPSNGARHYFILLCTLTGAWLLDCSHHDVEALRR
jgi:hypothetical protein